MIIKQNKGMSSIFMTFYLFFSGESSANIKQIYFIYWRFNLCNCSVLLSQMSTFNLEHFFEWISRFFLEMLEFPRKNTGN